MAIPGSVQKQVESIAWQDYRSSEKGMIVYYNSDPVSEIPIREVPEEYPSAIEPEPNYETGTYGLYGCPKPKIRNAFFKSKLRYLFFMTKYQGTNVDMLDQVIVTGYYRVKRTADIKRLHVRYLAEYGCMNEDICIALRADEVRFVGVKDAFVLTPEVLQQWGVHSRITRQTRILLDEQKAARLLEFLRSKDDRTGEYISETKRLSPAMDDEEEEMEDADAEALAQGDGDEPAGEEILEGNGSAALMSEAIESSAIVAEAYGESGTTSIDDQDEAAGSEETEEGARDTAAEDELEAEDTAESDNVQKNIIESTRQDDYTQTEAGSEDKTADNC